MPKILQQKTDTHFGAVGKDCENWREAETNDDDPDDEILADTPDDVVSILGFDPKEFSKPVPSAK
jgi:hypothetical protein